MNNIFKKITIISGGQTGVDRAALDFAIANKIDHGGWCPNGRLAEDGNINNTYNLNICNTKLYIQRTFLNVRDADATLILYLNHSDEGTILTKNFCIALNKLYLIIDLSKNNAWKEILDWLKEKNIQTLNIAGPRESNSPGIYVQTMNVLNQFK